MSINVYEQQLIQIRQALISCKDEADRSNLISLQNDLEELISLENLENEDSSETSEENFQESKKSLHQHLINEKCRAPYQVKGQGMISYHNAFIADVLSDDDDEEVTVKVFFLNPTQDSMKACDYYFSHSCTFDDNCKYSHGESVKYSILKEYQSPNYKLLKRKSHVLVKTESLWKPGSIIECSQELKSCQVKLHGSGKTFDCSFSDVLPPLESNADSSDLSTDDDDSEDESLRSSNVLIINDNFGEWEKYTTGIGSKILQKYGYKNGEGLGIRKDGITQPISARIYVQGKSLDYNMELNERKNQGTVAEKLKRQSLIQQKRSEKNYSRPESEVFSFLNNTICNIKPSSSKANLNKSEDVKTQSKTQLNISVFKIEEDIKKVESSLKKLKESMKRQSIDPAVSRNIQLQVDEKQRSLDHLHLTLSKVNNEQRSRKEKSKLTIF